MPDVSEQWCSVAIDESVSCVENMTEPRPGCVRIGSVPASSDRRGLLDLDFPPVHAQVASGTTTTGGAIRARRPSASRGRAARSPPHPPHLVYRQRCLLL